MDFRFITGPGVASRPAGTAAALRNFCLGALICTVLGTSASAQATLDFIDPLDTERVRIEERSGPSDRAVPSREREPSRFGTVSERDDGDSVLTRARDGAASGAGAVREGATGFWGTLRAALSSIAAALGLPTAVLIALLGLLIVGVATLVGWTLFRGRRRHAENAQDDVYARTSRRSVKRRTVGSPVAPKPVVAAKEDDFEETMPEDFDAIFADERPDPAPRRSEPPRAPVETGEADGWRKPNLDRLRDSIKADWKADKADKADARSPAASPPPAPRSAPRPAAMADPATRTLDDLSDGWEEWDEQDKPEDDIWGETLPATTTAQKDEDDTATSRIRALRESLRAS